MSDFIINKLSKLATLTTNEDDLASNSKSLPLEEGNGAGETSKTTFADEQPYKLLSPELWLYIFKNLDRNDLDSCEHVCTSWYNLIRYNNKYLAGRKIDYIIFSTKRAFSMTLSSGNIVKIYRVEKYFNNCGLQHSINDSSSMTVQTLRRRSCSWRPKPQQGPMQLYITELNELMADSKNKKEEEEADDETKYKWLGFGATGFYPHCPDVKTRYKISTPPKFFFAKLSKLLRNLDHVNYWVFHSFTLTNAFVEKFMHYVEPIIITKEVRLNRVKRSKVHHRAMLFFFGVVLGNKAILEKITAGGDAIITTS